MSEKSNCDCNSKPIPSQSLPHVTDCQKAIGYVIFDCVCLAIGGYGLRASVRAETVEEMAALSINATSAIEGQIEVIAHDGATTYQKARAVFSVLLTLKNGGMLGAVFGALVKSLKWWQMALYATTGLATILAALATDGVAFIAEVAAVLVTFAWLVADSVHAVNVCKLTPKSAPEEPTPVSPFQNPMPYLPQGAVMTANGSFLSFVDNLDDDDVASFSTNRTKIGNYEKFTIEPVDRDNHIFAIKTHDGKYVSAVNGGGESGKSGTDWAVRSDANSIGPAEAVVIILNDFDPDNGETETYSFMTPQGHYLTATHGGGQHKEGDPMQTSAKSIGRTELFTLQTLQNDGAAAERYRVTGQSTTILDPSFETPTLPNGQFEYNPNSSPWTFDSSTGISSNGSGFTRKNPSAPSGNQVAFIQGKGKIKQTITVFPGIYTISFYAAQRANYGGYNTITIKVGDQDVYECKPKGTTYSVYTTPSFELAGGNHELEFKGENPEGGDNTCFIDMIVANKV